jgi:hypothetical protein
VEYRFDTPQQVRHVRLTFDSDLNRPEKNQPHYFPLDAELVSVPETMVRAFRIEALGDDGTWQVIVREESNYQRLVHLNVDVETEAVRFIPEATWGAPDAHVFAWDVS